ncbi:MAG: universal stress protein [Flavobacteriales bacterium]|nr:universal stress protein [Flavobacteriales bacterium]
MKAIVPIDFSLGSRAAVKFALNLSELLPEMELEFLYCNTLVHPSHARIHTIKLPTAAEQRNKILAEMKHFVERTAAERSLVLKGVSYHFEDRAKAAPAIIEAAQAGKANLIVMGTTGSSNLRRIVMGSTAVKVMEGAPCAVITVPLGYRIRSIKEIAVGSELVNPVKEMRFVHNLLSGLQAHYTIFHVYPVFPQKVVPTKTYMAQIEEKLRTFLDAGRFSLLLVKTKEENQLSAGLEKGIKRIHPGLLVMFHRKRNWLDKILSRSETASLVFHTKVPVMSVRTDLLKKAEG